MMWFILFGTMFGTPLKTILWNVRHSKNGLSFFFCLSQCMPCDAITKSVSFRERKTKSYSPIDEKFINRTNINQPVSNRWSIYIDFCIAYSIHYTTSIYVPLQTITNIYFILIFFYLLKIHSITNVHTKDHTKSAT